MTELQWEPVSQNNDDIYSSSLRSQKAHNRQLFGNADLNKNNLVTKQEIEDALKGGNITQEEADLLFKTYDIQRKNEDKGYDLYPKMSLWEFMKAFNKVMEEEPEPFFSDEEINWANKEFVLKALKKNGSEYNKVDIIIKNDRDIILAAVSSSGSTLQVVPDQFRSDREVVLAAVKNSGFALQLADKKFESDREVVLAAASQWGWIITKIKVDHKSDREIVLAAVKSTGAVLGDIPAYQKDREIVIAAVTSYGDSIRYASSDLRNDRFIAMAAINAKGFDPNSAGPVEHLSEKLKDDKDLALKAINLKPKAFMFVSGRLKADMDVVKDAIKGDASMVKYMLDDLKKDRQVILSLIKENYEVMKHVDGLMIKTQLNEDEDEMFKSSIQLPVLFVRKKDFILEAMGVDGRALNCLSDDNKNDLDVIIEAIRQNTSVISEVSGALRNHVDVQSAYLRHIFYDADLNADLVLTREELNEADRSGAILKNETVFLKEAMNQKRATSGNETSATASITFAEYKKARNELIKEKPWIKLTIGEGSETTEEMDEIFSEDEIKWSMRSFVISELKKDGMKLEKADEFFRKDKKIVSLAVSQNKDSFKFAHNSLKKDKEFILKLLNDNVGKDGGLYRYVDETIKNDKQFALQVVDNSYGNSSAYRYFIDEFKKDKDIAIIAVQNSSKTIEYADKSMKSDRDVVLAAVGLFGGALEHADPSFRDDKEVVINALKKDGMMIKIVGDKLKVDKEIALIAVTQNPDSFPLLNADLRNDEQIINIVIKAKPFLIIHAGKSMQDKHPKLMGIIQKLKSLRVTCPTRFETVETAEIMIRNRSAQSYGRPVLLIIYPLSDWNDAFESNNIKDFIEKGYYDVVYYEASSDVDLFRAVKETGAKRKISRMIIGGHGSQESTSFGANDPARSNMGNEDKYLDFSEEDELKDLAPFLAPKSIIIMESCSTGKEGTEGKNIANLIKETFPQSEVFAPKVPAGISAFVIDENGKISGVEYSCGEADTYHVK